MKTARLICAIAVLACTSLLAAEQANTKHHHYKVIAINTLGGPNFFANFSGAQTRILNNRGTLTGGLENTVADPHCFNFPECVDILTFQWDQGELTNLGTLPGGDNSQGYWISDTGIIAGLAQNGEEDPALLGFPVPIGDEVFHAATWSHGKITDLGTLGGLLSIAQAVNNRGQVVGVAENNVPESVPTILGASAGGSAPLSFFTGTQFRAFLWEHGTMRDLGTLGGPEAWARTINESGQIAGVSYTDSSVNPASGLPSYDAFLWDHGKMTDLGNLGGTQSDVEGLNNHGQVIGLMSLPGEAASRPFFWDKGTLTDLGTFGGNFGLAIGLNESGEVVGTATTVGDQAQYAFLWKAGVLTNLGSAPGDGCGIAQQINESGQAVGPSFPCAVGPFGGADDATLFDHGAAINLNNFVPPGSDYHLTGDDSFINDHGEIAVTGLLANGDLRLFFLVPCDEKHPSLDGCDYSTVDSEAETKLRPRSATRGIFDGLTSRGLTSQPRTGNRAWETSSSNAHR